MVLNVMCYFFLKHGVLDTAMVQQPKTLACVICPALGTDTFSEPAEKT